MTIFLQPADPSAPHARLSREAGPGARRPRFVHGLGGLASAASAASLMLVTGVDWPMRALPIALRGLLGAP